MLKIEHRIHEMVPELNRVSSGATEYTKDLGDRLCATDQFTDLVFVESSYVLDIPRQRYMGAWRSVNDIQAQAGPQRFQEILSMIEEELGDLQIVPVPYKTRAWTVRRKA